MREGGRERKKEREREREREKDIHIHGKREKEGAKEKNVRCITWRKGRRKTKSSVHSRTTRKTTHSK